METLSAYSAVIDQLKPLVYAPDFDQMLERLTRNESRSVRFLIKMELKRLAAPCSRVIDLRGRVDGHCHPFEHDGRVHYLDDVAENTYVRVAKDFQNRYTVGVYESVMNTENNFRVMHQRGQELRLKEVQDQARKTPEDEALLLANNQVPNYPGKQIQFGEYFARNEERMHFSVDIRVTLPDGSLVSGITSDLSVGGARIRIPANSKIFESEIIYLRLVGLEEEFVLDEFAGGLRYQVVGLDKRTSEHRWLRLKRDFDADNFDEFLQRLIRGYKRRYKLNLDHTVEMVTTRGYEHTFFPRMSAMPVFFEREGKGVQPATIFTTDNNRQIVDYWRDENYVLQIRGLFTPARLRNLVNGKVNSLLVYCFSHSAKGKLFFYSATREELQEHDLQEQFFGYGASKPGWRVFKLNLSKVTDDQSRIPQLNFEGEGEISTTESALPPRASAQVAKYAIVVWLQDVTTEMATERYRSYEYDMKRANALSRFGHKKVAGEKIAIEGCSYGNLRQEPRFQYKSPLSVLHGDHLVEGMTRDFSTKGIQIELEAPLPCEKGDVVYLELPALQKISKTYQLTGLPYQVMGKNPTDTVLHLKIQGDEKRHVGCQFFQSLIKSNRNKLPMAKEPAKLDGLAEGLRNICCHSLPSTAFYVRKQGISFAVDTIATSPRSNSVQEQFKRLATNGNDLNLYPLVKSEHFHQELIEPLKALSREHRPLERELYVRMRFNSEGKIQHIQCRYADDFRTEVQRRMFIIDSVHSGEFYAWRLLLSRTGRPDLEMVSNELRYISQYAIHKARKLENEMWGIIGVGEIIDVTEEVLSRYPLPQLPDFARSDTAKENVD